MQNTSMALKARFLADGVEIPGLTRLGEVPLENATIEVPTFNRKRKIHTGVVDMPEVPATFETRRDTDTRKILRDWYEKQQVKDVTVIYTDAEGVEVNRVLWSGVECKAFKDPEVDFGNISYARVEVTFLPYDIVEV